jgi:hypothetical protein
MCTGSQPAATPIKTTCTAGPGRPLPAQPDHVPGQRRLHGLQATAAGFRVAGRLQDHAVRRRQRVHRVRIVVRDRHAGGGGQGRQRPHIHVQRQLPQGILRRNRTDNLDNPPLQPFKATLRSPASGWLRSQRSAERDTSAGPGLPPGPMSDLVLILGGVGEVPPPGFPARLSAGRASAWSAARPGCTAAFRPASARCSSCPPGSSPGPSTRSHMATGRRATAW